MEKVIELINILNLEENFLLNSKNEIRSKTTMYFINLLIKKIIDMF